MEASRCFFNWLIKNGRVQINPLLSVEKVRTEGRETRQRRALAYEEVRWLLAVAGERKPIYLMAVHTGLRRSELAALKWGDVHLEADSPFVQVRASTTKNSKPAAMRLLPELVKALQEIKGDSQPNEPVFKRFPRIERFQRDLKKAEIPYCDATGHFADFHSLRKTFGTNLANAGVPSRVAMTLMRHSDRRLTDKIYTDENLLGTWSAFDALPSYTKAASQGASQKLGAGSQSGSLAVTMSNGSENEKAIVSIGGSRIVALHVASGHNVGNGGSGGARTRNLCRDRAAL